MQVLEIMKKDFPYQNYQGKIHQLEDGDAIVFDENGQVELLKKKFDK